MNNNTQPLREIFLIHKTGRKERREGEERKEGKEREKWEGERRKGGMINIKVPQNDLTREYAPSPPSPHGQSKSHNSIACC